jgi:hypothetical protein
MAERLRMTRPAAGLSRLVLGALTLGAIGVQVRLHVGAGFPLLNIFSYCTVLSNAIAGVVLLIGAYCDGAGRPAPSWHDRARYAATLYMVVVGLVFVTLLRNADLGMLLPWINAVHHYLMPVAMVGDWLLRPPSARPTARDGALALLFPLTYVVYSLVRGAATGWYPYPFFNPGVVGGYGVVTGYIVAMLVAFLVVGWALRDRRPERQDGRAPMEHV